MYKVVRRPCSQQPSVPPSSLLYKEPEVRLVPTRGQVLWGSDQGSSPGPKDNCSDLILLASNCSDWCVTRFWPIHDESLLGFPGNAPP